MLHCILHCIIHYRTTAYRGISSRWMCVKHLNRCKTSTCWRVDGLVFFVFFLLLFSQQGWMHGQTLPFHDDMTEGRLRHVPAISTSFSCNRLSLEPAWREFWVSAISFPVRFRNLSRWERFGLVEREGSASNWFHLALTMAMVASCFSVGLFTDPFLSGVIGMFLHARCIPHQNSQWQFWVSKCV